MSAPYLTLDIKRRDKHLIYNLNTQRFYNNQKELKYWNSNNNRKNNINN